MTDQSTKAGRQGPRTAGNRPDLSADLDARTAKIDGHLDGLDHALTAAMAGIDKRQERLNLELDLQIDGLVQQRVLENARRLEGIYQGPEGVTHYQEMLRHLTGDSSAKEASPSLETPDQLSGLTLRSPATLEAPATPRIAALSEAVSADDRRPSGDQHAQSAPTIRGVSNLDRQLEEMRLRGEHEYVSMMIRRNLSLIGTMGRIYGPEHEFVTQYKKELIEKQRELAQIQVQIANLRQQGGQNQPPQPPLNPPPPPRSPAQADTQRAAPISRRAMDRAEQDAVRSGNAAPPPNPGGGQVVDSDQQAKPASQLHRGGDARFVGSRDQHLVDVSERPQVDQDRLDIARQLLETKRINLGDIRDVDLLLKSLCCLNFGLLQKLKQAGYTFAPGRYNVAQGLPDIHGRATVSGDSTDRAGGIHHSDKKIVVRTWMEDGQLQLSMSVLMHEIGHAVFDTLLVNERRVLDKFRAAHKAEKDGMHRDYFKSESEFFAETFSMFSLRPDELKAKFPQTYALYREVFPLDSRWTSLGVTGSMMSANDLYFFERDMRPAILEDGNPIGALELLSRVEALNAARIGRGISPESTILFVDGEELGVNSVMEHLGHELCMQRGQRAPFNELEGTITIDQATLNDPQSLFKHLSGGLGAILYIPADLNVTYNHPFFATYREFCKRNNGMYHLAIGNRGREAEKFLEGLSDTSIHFPSSSIRLEPLDRFKLVELTRRIAVQNGYTLPQETVDKLLELVHLGGTYRDGYRVWQKIQKAYQDRVTRGSASHTDVNSITPADIDSAKIVQERDPLSKLESQFALQEAAVQKTKEIIALARMKRANPDPQPLALNFEGNPGTGKSSFAGLFAQSLAANQVVDSPSPTFLTASELVSMGVQAAKKKFEEGKNGVIFIDEAHQLDPKSNPDGKKIIDLLVPMLTNPEYARTVFVFAGYPRKMDQMLSADPGFKSRVQTVSFRDYKVEELRQIAQRNLTANNVICSDQTFDALMRRIDRMQRATENPGNARDVAKTIEDVLRSQAERLSRLPSDQVTETVRQTIELVDVVDPRQVTPDSVMKEIEQKIPGNEQLKEFLRSIEKKVAKNIEKGLPIYNNVPFEIALDGGSGTGKTTVIAPLVTKLYAALGLIGQDRLEVQTGGSLVGEFVGTAGAVVKAAFTAGKGGALLIDEIVSMTNAPKYSDDAIKELLTQISANRSKPQMLLFVADYPDNVDRFLSFDQGLSSRFRIRITAEKISTTGALAIINRLMDQNGSTLESGSERVLEAKLKQLTTLPAFASGRDIENLCTNLSDEADKHSVISRSAIERCLDQFIAEVSRRPPPKGAPATSDDARIATATQHAPAEKREASVQKKTRQDVLDAQSKVAEKFKDLANSDHQAMAKMIADPRSEYYTDLGVALGIDAQEAFETRAEVVAEIVEEYKEKDLKFDYDCPFCGRVNSMGCVYFSFSEMANPNSFVYSTEWLIQNSKKPPYESEA